MPDGYLDFSNMSGWKRTDLKNYLTERAVQAYNDKEAEMGAERFREIERVILLMVVDRKWMDHIDAMDQLRQGIGLRSYGQQDPVRAYNEEGFDMFEEMNHSIKEDTLKGLFNVRPVEEIERKQVAKETKTSEDQVTVVKGKKIGRNDPCPCGSGKKYKKCCGRDA